jgi:hypothetical protein
MNIKASDALPILGTVGTWVMYNFDWLLTRSVGVATLIFTVLKIIQLVRNWNKPQKD